MDKEKAVKILNVNCLKNPEGKEKLKNMISKTKWMKGKEVNVFNLQKLYNKVSKKYDVSIGTMLKSEDSYNVSIVKKKKDSNGKYYKYDWIETVYAFDLEELMFKIILLMYFYIVKGIKFKDEI